ncbi:MAG: hypothetical protein FWH32_08485 [Clostridiales bacterium]|nr:hypothetical protein [Clostridiales bacterium]
MAEKIEKDIIGMMKRKLGMQFSCSPDIYEMSFFSDAFHMTYYEFAYLLMEVMDKYKIQMRSEELLDSGILTIRGLSAIIEKRFV